MLERLVGELFNKAAVPIGKRASSLSTCGVPLSLSGYSLPQRDVRVLHGDIHHRISVSHPRLAHLRPKGLGCERTYD